jgi:hypothetical protein
MAYQERGSGPPLFDGKNYQMWSKRMAAFLRGKGQILWDVTVDNSYVQAMNFLAPGSRDIFDERSAGSWRTVRPAQQPPLPAVDFAFFTVGIQMRTVREGIADSP